MATNPSKPPDHHQPKQAAPAKTPQCNCSNISIMQLFHEMKQEFPTVPDNVVSDLVYANCHNRLGCIESMRKAAIGYPCSAQAYPSQSIQAAKTSPVTPQSPQQQAVVAATKPPTPPKRGGLVPMVRQVSESNQRSPKSSVSAESSSEGEGTPTLAFNFANSRNTFLRNAEAQRPTTLPVKKDFYAIPSPKPIRQAPPPPPASNEGLNVSLNVTVSPVASRRPPNRHTSALQVQPESPFLVDQDQSPRSYTSVNFTLRQPSNSPQSPIDISAGPSLTYSSSSFDARQGYQSRLQITVGGTPGPNGNGGLIGSGGSISAMRARPRSCYNIQEEVDYEQQLQNSINGERFIKPGLSLPNVGLVDTSQHLTKNAEEKLRRQLEQKQRIEAELKNVRHHLETMHRDIRVLSRPIPPGGLNRLVDDIAQLRQECVRMAAELDEAGVPVLGEITESVNPNVNLDGINVLGVPQTRPPKPPRPPPPAIALTNNNNQTTQNHMLNNQNHVYTYDFERNYFRHLEDNNLNPVNRNSLNNNNLSDGPSWICSVCTFQNHPLLDKCEQCEMPNINVMAGSVTTTTTTSGGTTGNNNNNNNNNNDLAQLNSRIQITPFDFGVRHRRTDNQYQQMSASSSCDSLSCINPRDNDNNVSVVSSQAPTTSSSSYVPSFLQATNPFATAKNDGHAFPIIGSQLTNAILLPATVVTPTLCMPGANNAPSTMIPTSGDYKTHRHTPSM